MNRSIRLSISLWLLLFGFASLTFGQKIVNKPGRMWIAADNKNAAVMQVMKTERKLKGNLTQYELCEDDGEFHAIETIIKYPTGEETLNLTKFEVTLEERTHTGPNNKRLDYYALVYAGEKSKYIIGHARHGARKRDTGSRGRVSIRLLNRAIEHTPLLDQTKTATQRGDCDAPPVDDVGEEENLAEGPGGGPPPTFILD